MNENENTEQVQETETIQETAPEIVIDYKAKFEKSNETIRQLRTELSMERHHVVPEHRELMQKMYPEAFKPKVPEFSVSTTGVSGIRDKSGFLAGFTGNKPL